MKCINFDRAFERYMACLLYTSKLEEVEAETAPRESEE